MTYFQAQTIETPTSYSLLQMLHKPSIFERLTKWAIKLSELDIRYVLATAIKALAITNFLVDLTP